MREARHRDELPAGASKAWAIRLGISLPFLLVGGGLLWMWATSASPPDKPTRPQPVLTLPDLQTSASLSPDGTRIAYCRQESSEHGNPGLYVKTIDDKNALRLSPDACSQGPPAWSPDGSFLACVHSSSEKGCGLYRIPVAGGSMLRLGDCLLSPRDLAWSADGRWLAFSDLEQAGSPRRIFLLDLENSKRKPLTDPAPVSLGDRYPAFSPDGTRLAFRRAAGAGQHDIFLAPLPDGKPIRRITYDKHARIRGLDWMAQGDEIIFASDRAGRSALWRMAASGGTPRRIPIPDHRVALPRTARLGNRLIYQRSTDAAGLWSVALDGKGSAQGEPRRILDSAGSELHPRLSPDGSRLAFTSNRTGAFEVWTGKLDGSELTQRTELQGAPANSPRWFPDGSRLVFDAFQQGSGDLYLAVEGSRSPRLLTLEPSDELNAGVSRDGRYLYFSSNRRNSYQIWKMPSGGGRAVQVTVRGGFLAQEGPRREYLYFSKLEQPGIWRMPIQGGNEERVVDALQTSDWGSWAVRKGGVYFVQRQPAALAFFSFQDGRVRTVVQPSKQIPSSNPVLEVSEDERLLIFGLVERSGGEVMLVEL